MISQTGILKAVRTTKNIKCRNVVKYGENYSGTVHQETAVEGYQYCTFLQRALELLISENYTNFISQ